MNISSWPLCCKSLITSDFQLNMLCSQVVDTLLHGSASAADYVQLETLKFIAMDLVSLQVTRDSLFLGGKVASVLSQYMNSNLDCCSYCVLPVRGCFTY